MRRAPPPAGRLTDPIGRRIGTISAWTGGALLAVLVVLRSGVSEYSNIDRLLAVASRLPDPARDYLTLSLPGGVLSRLLGIDTEAAWVVLHAGVLLAVVAWVVWQVARWELPAGRHRDAAILLGTRVFAVACWPAYLEVVRAAVATPRAPDEDDTNGVDLVRQLSTFVLIIAVLTPAPVTWVGGEPLVPWQDLLDLVP